MKKGSYINTLTRVRFLSENILSRHTKNGKKEIIPKERKPKFKFSLIRKARKFLEKFEDDYDIKKLEKLFFEKEDIGTLRVVFLLRRKKHRKLNLPKSLIRRLINSRCQVGEMK